MESVVQAWLARQCSAIPGVGRGVAWLRRGNVVACFPAGVPAPDLMELAEAAAAAGSPQVCPPRARGETPAGKSWQVAAPLACVPGGGAIVVEVSVEDACDADDVVALLHCAATGLHVLTEESADVVSIAALALEHARYRDAATAVATELATRLGCERVSIGFLRRGQTRIEAMSHSAQFREEANLALELAAAMDEAVDQDARIVWPAHATSVADGLRITRAHQRLAERHEAGGVCSVPLVRTGSIVGAITFEWPAASGAPEASRIAACERAAALLGPMLELKRTADARMRDRLRERVSKLAGPGNVALKASAILASVALVVLAFAQGTYRVSARATLEGRVQRAVVAGFDGYISEANARAGDVVRRGQILGRLDERDLVLEKRKLTGRIAQLRREYREAFAGLDRTQVSIASAKMAQAEAELGLLDEQLSRTVLVAPFDGVVVEGDLTQSLGAPVGKGDLLFQVAPLDGYRIILEVDERDISEIRTGQSGDLALQSMPGRPLPLTIERLTPVATSENGHNAFRVEARLDRQVDALRPGMKGLAKIETEKRQLLWIWTHDLADWLRLWTWSWLP